MWIYSYRSRPPPSVALAAVCNAIDIFDWPPPRWEFKGFFSLLLIRNPSLYACHSAPSISSYLYTYLHACASLVSIQGALTSSATTNCPLKFPLVFHSTHSRPVTVRRHIAQAAAAATASTGAAQSHSAQGYVCCGPQSNDGSAAASAAVLVVTVATAAARGQWLCGAQGSWRAHIGHDAPTTAAAAAGPTHCGAAPHGQGEAERRLKGRGER